MINNATAEGADALILDLEDGCPIPEKETGRVFARDSIPFLKEHTISVYVRVNSRETGWTIEDLSYVVVQGLDGIMLSKTETEDDIVYADRLLFEEEIRKGIKSNSISIIALIETPKGILNVSAIIAASKRVVAIGFGAGDFSREMGAGMGVTRISPDEYFSMILYARSSIGIAARAAGIQAIDTPFFGLVIDIDGLIKESQKVKLLGFCGKQLTHPRHVESVNAVFSPTKEDITLAKNVVKAYEEAKSKGLGATTIGGKMIDYGSFKRAEALLSFAKTIEN
jgi:citrate lyase subunit beta/citryl-CoA lyase